MISLLVVSATIGRQIEIGKEVKEKVSNLVKNIDGLEIFDPLTFL